MGSGLTQNSPEYFQFVERTAGLTNPEQPAPPNGGQRQIPQAAPGRQTASLHSQTRPRGDHIPKEFVDHAMKVWGFTKKENGRQVPDMQLVSQSWAEALRMEQATGSEGFKRGNPWRNAR
jgi:hypothetical protein